MYASVNKNHKKVNLNRKTFLQTIRQALTLVKQFHSLTNLTNFQTSSIGRYDI